MTNLTDLLAGVPRLDLEQPESHMGSAYMRADPDGDYVRLSDVLAALAAERAKVESVIRIAASLFPGGYDNNHARICAAITEAGQ